MVEVMLASARMTLTNGRCALSGRSCEDAHHTTCSQSAFVLLSLILSSRLRRLLTSYSRTVSIEGPVPNLCGALAHANIKRLTFIECSTLIAVISAPLWNGETARFAGMFTVQDIIHLIQYYYLQSEGYDSVSSDVEQFRLESLRG